MPSAAGLFDPIENSWAALGSLSSISFPFAPHSHLPPPPVFWRFVDHLEVGVGDDAYCSFFGKVRGSLTTLLVQPRFHDHGWAAYGDDISVARTDCSSIFRV